MPTAKRFKRQQKRDQAKRAKRMEKIVDEMARVHSQFADDRDSLYAIASEMVCSTTYSLVRPDALDHGNVLGRILKHRLRRDGFDCSDCEMTSYMGTLISGFARNAVSDNFYFADVLLCISIHYLDLPLIRITDTERNWHAALVPNSDRSLRDLARSLAGNESHSVRFWLRFSALKRIYPIDTKRDVSDRKSHIENFKVTTEDVCRGETENLDRWVEVPDDLCDDLVLGTYEDTVGDDYRCFRPRELRVEHSAKHFDADYVSKDNEQINFETLRVGDIIDAKDSDTHSNWWEAVVRFACSSYVCVHFIGWTAQWDEKIYAIESGRVAPRGTRTKGLEGREHLKESRRLAAWCYPQCSLFLRQLYAHYKGVCKSFNDDKGYGFIVSDDVSGDLYVQKEDIYGAFQSLAEGESVEFDISYSFYTDRRRAVRVTGPGGCAVKGNAGGGLRGSHFKMGQTDEELRSELQRSARIGTRRSRA